VFAPGALGSVSQNVQYTQVKEVAVTDSAESVVRNFFACFPASDVDEVIGYFHDDAVYIDGPRGVHKGINAIRTELQSQLEMVPNTTVDIKALAGSGGTVLTERVDQCEIAGKSVGMEVVGVFDVNSKGQVTRWRDYYDLPTLVEQFTAATASHS
jgi:limonene-1,2-epoxide hydrolase